MFYFVSRQCNVKKFLKGQFTQKQKCTHYLLALEWFQLFMSFIILLNTRRYFKKAENLLPLTSIGGRTKEVNGYIFSAFF